MESTQRLMSTRLSSAPISQSSVERSGNYLPAASDNPRLKKLKESLYQAEQQAKFLHLQAEVESLFQKLQTLKQQRTSSANSQTSE
jgi:hypothetical protein